MTIPRLLPQFISILLLPLATHAADPVRITGREAEAIQRATQIFKSKQGTKFEGAPVYGDLRHYTVEIERHGNRLEVDFVPEQPPLKPNEAGTGGGTMYAGKSSMYFRSVHSNFLKSTTPGSDANVI